MCIIEKSLWRTRIVLMSFSLSIYHATIHKATEFLLFPAFLTNKLLLFYLLYYFPGRYSTPFIHVIENCLLFHLTFCLS